MDRKFAIQIVALLLIIFGSLYYSTNQSTLPSIPGLPIVPVAQKTATISDITINIEIADTKEKRNKGLGYRESLASDSGMLFLFQDTGKHTFWMKGMKFPIDIIWIKGTEVVDIIKNAAVPPVDQKDETLPIYAPQIEIDKVLEVNAGFVDSHGIKVGNNLEVH